MIDKVINETTCMGCRMCGDICPKTAICFREGSDGFVYPVVDYQTCIECNLCIKRCPIAGEKTVFGRFEIPETYAVWNKDDLIRKKSTSGGAFSAFANAILERGGVVAGCVYTDDYKSAYHMIANTTEELTGLIGSKYFESDLSGIYIKIKHALEAGKLVLFAGSPCQAAALNNYLGKDYKNLYSCTYICRGINSPKAYRAYLSELEKKYQSVVTKVHFKSKRQGWTNLGVEITFANGKVDYTNKINNPFISGYNIGNLYLRKSCYECHFKSLPFVSDITYGDFWGGKFGKDDMIKGVSIVMVNSQKGKELLDWSEQSINVFRQDISETTNGCLFDSAPLKMAEREAFFDRVNSDDFSRIVWEKLETTEFRQLIKFYWFNFKRKIRILLGRKDRL